MDSSETPRGTQTVVKAGALDPGGRLRPARRSRDAGGAGRRRSHPHRRDGRALRAQPLDGRHRSCASLRRVTRLPLEVHLMIDNPDLFLDEFAEAGADAMVVHWEGNANLHRTIQRIKALGKRAGVAINPATPASVLEEILPEVALVLVMTVNPGFGHQHFLSGTLPKIRRVRRLIEQIDTPAKSRSTAGSIPSRRLWRCPPAPMRWSRARRSSTRIFRWPRRWIGSEPASSQRERRESDDG